MGIARTILPFCVGLLTLPAGGAAAPGPIRRAAACG